MIWIYLFLVCASKTIINGQDPVPSGGGVPDLSALTGGSSSDSAGSATNLVTDTRPRVSDLTSGPGTSASDLSAGTGTVSSSGVPSLNTIIGPVPPAGGQTAPAGGTTGFVAGAGQPPRIDSSLPSGTGPRLPGPGGIGPGMTGRADTGGGIGPRTGTGLLGGAMAPGTGMGTGVISDPMAAGRMGVGFRGGLPPSMSGSRVPFDSGIGRMDMRAGSRPLDPVGPITYDPFAAGRPLAPGLAGGPRAGGPAGSGLLLARGARPAVGTGVGMGGVTLRRGDTAIGAAGTSSMAGRRVGSGPLGPFPGPGPLPGPGMTFDAMGRPVTSIDPMTGFPLPGPGVTATGDRFRAGIYPGMGPGFAGSGAAAGMRPDMGPGFVGSGAATGVRPDMGPGFAGSGAATGVRPGMGPGFAGSGAAAGIRPGMGPGFAGSGATTGVRPGMGPGFAGSGTATGVRPGVGSDFAGSGAATGVRPGMGPGFAGSGAATGVRPGMGPGFAGSGAATGVRPGMDSGFAGSGTGFMATGDRFRTGAPAGMGPVGLGPGAGMDPGFGGFPGGSAFIPPPAGGFDGSMGAGVGGRLPGGSGIGMMPPGTGPALRTDTGSSATNMTGGAPGGMTASGAGAGGGGAGRALDMRGSGVDFTRGGVRIGDPRGLPPPYMPYASMYPGSMYSPSSSYYAGFTPGKFHT